jgi:hypothetical protein
LDARNYNQDIRGRLRERNINGAGGTTFTPNDTEGWAIGLLPDYWNGNDVVLNSRTVREAGWFSYLGFPPGEGNGKKLTADKIYTLEVWD